MPATPFIKKILHKGIAAVNSRRRFPESSYRLQFHAGFKFRDATALIPYLHDLGITDLYASPYLKARPGSKHGYDIIDHRTLNPEIGTEEEYAAMTAALQAHAMGQLLDTVPNHMGIAGNENVWWNDVLENGISSPFAGFFDINWHSYKPDLYDKVLLPILGDPYGKVLESGQIRLSYEAGTFIVHYYDHRFPVAPGSYQVILAHRLPELEQALGKEAEPFSEYQSILTAIRNLPPHSETDPAKVAERQREKEVVKRRLAALTESSTPVREFIEQNVTLFNGKEGDRRSFDLLDGLLNQQAYRLAYWRVASDEINYRRFFDINELAALSMERPEVFAATHELIFRLLREGKVTGLRIDHPDGLFDPKQYLQRLQQQYLLEMARAVFEAQPEYRGQAWKEVEGLVLEEIKRRQQGRTALPSRPATPDGSGEPSGQEANDLLRRPLYVVVEKILGRGEPLPEDWPVYGTSGYDFLNVLNGLFVDAANARAFDRVYHRWREADALLGNLIYQNKFLILQVALAGELHMLGHQLDRLSEKDRWSRDFTLNSLRHALRDIIACFPVYRSYIAGDEIHPLDRIYVETAVARARRKNPAISALLFDFVRDMLLLHYPESASEQDRAEQRRFAGKFQQVTAPVMAKGLEDTTFYVYNRLLSLNEVGGDPDQFGVPPDAFHRYNQDRQARWPWSLSASCSHDTKRSEDVRARLNVLSEIPQEWQKRLTRWNRLNRRYREQLEDMVAPDTNDEYLFYQTLVGAWPLEPYSPEEFSTFVERIQAYMQKAVHEAKVHSSWINPNPAYDDAIKQFVSRVLNVKNRRFLDDMRAFQRRISHWGLFNSLSHALLKITSPGVPDIYQGTELWDFSLVDPDNRRPVDFGRRRQLLQELQSRLAGSEPRLPELARELTQAKEDGRVKLYVTRQALHYRREHPGLFAIGEYQPANAAGPRQENIAGFVRRLANHCAVAVVPRLVTRLTAQPGDLPLGREIWLDTVVLLPGLAGNRRLRNIFTGEVLTTSERKGQGVLPLAEVFAIFPVAVLVAHD